VSPIDVADMGSSVLHARPAMDCGSSGTKRCGQFDHDGLGAFVAPGKATCQGSQCSG
jgi:hypothetical protein